MREFRDAPGLQGRQVLVTRPAASAAGLNAALLAAGALPLALPLIELEPDAAVLASLPARLAEADWLIPVSPGAIELAAPVLAQHLSPHTRLACVGAASAKQLAALAGRAVLHPQGERSDAAALLALPELQELAGQRVLLLRGENGRDELPAALAARGAVLDDCQAYRRVPLNPDFAEFDAALAAGTLAAAVVTSSEIARLLFQLAGPARVESLQSLVYGVPHPRIATTLAELGATHLVTSRASDSAIVAGLSEWFARQR